MEEPNVAERERVDLMTRSLPKARRGAFTLVEVLLALALATIVLSALQSLIMIAGRAIPDLDGVQASTVAASDALERLTGEVSVAVEVLEVSASSITFSVNDWTGDDIVETIKYAWSGAAGDPLLRAVNGGNASVLIESVESFSLTSGTSVRNVMVNGETKEYADQLVQSIDLTDLVPDYVNPTTAYAQLIVPDLPADSFEWRVEDVTIWVYWASASTGDLIVELRNTDAGTGLPGMTVYKSVRVDTGPLGNPMTKVTVQFGSTKFRPEETPCLVVRAEDPGVSCVLVNGISYQPLAGRTAMTSSDGGTTWVADTNKIWRHYVFADVWTNTGGMESRSTLDMLETSVATGSPLVTVTRSVWPLNTPEVLP